MKFTASLTLALSGALFLSLAPMAGAQNSFTFDENGNGNINGTPVMGALLPDASNGGNLDLTYFITTLFGGPVGNGDVTVLDASGAISDAIRFTDANGDLTGGTADRLIFYSTDSGALADTGLPANLGTGAVGGPVTETATDTFDYGPYHGISGAATTPEPGAYALLGSLGLTGAAFLRRRRAR